MKILNLYLENFAHIYSGMNKYVVELDLSDYDRIINIIIGKMGSCKSIILGHLQPFSNLGTIDIRNQDSIILENKNGNKRITYQDESDIYVINHDYIWKKDHHTVKSFITKNGEELNPTGSVTLFKSIVELELGIHQSYLTLLRLGSNVTNLIDYKSADRKSYMASMLKDTELYQMLYKNLNEEMRTVNAQINVLTSKMSTLSKGNLDSLKEDYQFIQSKLTDKKNMLEDFTKKYYSLIGKSDALLKGKSIDIFLIELNQLETSKKELNDSIKDKEFEIAEFSSKYSSISEVSKEIGRIGNQLHSNSVILNKLEESYEIKHNELSKLREKQLIANSDEHIQKIKKEYNELINITNKMKDDLIDFNCPYPSSYLKALVPQLNTINVLINEIKQYKKEDIDKVNKLGSNAIKFANFEISKINKERLSIQKQLNQLEFAGKYEPTEVVYVPPMCPSEDCPYRKTHPITLASDKSTGVNDKYFEITQKLDRLDVLTYSYAEYQSIYAKISSFKSQYYSINKVLKDLDILIITKADRILDNIHNEIWYNYDKLIDIINLVETREKYYEITERLNVVSSEITEYNIIDTEDINFSIDKIQTDIDDITTSITDITSVNNRLREEERSLNDVYMKLSNLDISKKELETLQLDYKNICAKLIEMEVSKDKVVEYKNNINEISISIKDIEKDINDYTKEFDRLKTVLNDISYAQKEYDELKQDQEILKLIVKASSSNKGIPLYYIQLFLRECKDVLNDLVSNVFGDAIEILDFEISETEFKIPYSINGSRVEDVSKASQGQRSIISLALSFALMRQATSHYNIILLDEMDGPLYKADRNKFISILYKQIMAIGGEQVFLVSHNNTFDGEPVNIIMTTDEVVDNSNCNIIKL